MVSASGIDKWIENFDWWVNYIKGFDYPDIYNYTMFLEVRNNDWTKEKIDLYIKFLEHVFDYFLYDYYNNDRELMAKDLFLKFNDDGPKNYNIITISE